MLVTSPLSDTAQTIPLLPPPSPPKTRLPMLHWLLYSHVESPGSSTRASLSTMLRYFALERDSCVDFCIDILLERDNIVVYDFCDDFCLLIFALDFPCRFLGASIFMC